MRDPSVFDGGGRWKAPTLLGCAAGCTSAEVSRSHLCCTTGLAAARGPPWRRWAAVGGRPPAWSDHLSSTGAITNLTPRLTIVASAAQQAFPPGSGRPPGPHTRTRLSTLFLLLSAHHPPVPASLTTLHCLPPIAEHSSTPGAGCRAPAWSSAGCAGGCAGFQREKEAAPRCGGGDPTGSADSGGGRPQTLAA